MQTFKQAKLEFERHFMTAALLENAGAFNRTARNIGMNKVTMQAVLARTGVDRGALVPRDNGAFAPNIGPALTLLRPIRYNVRALIEAATPDELKEFADLCHVIVENIENIESRTQ